MAKTIKEIMNPELFSLRPNDGTEEALGYIVALGITAAPVLDEERRPIGVASFRDLLLPHAPAKVAERMTVPAVTVAEDATIEAAARIVAERGVHRVVVVDAEGRAVGVASTLDLVRGLVGVPAAHPATFPHWDKARGISWTDDVELEVDRLDAAPDTAGVLALVSGGKGVVERVVWGEPANNVRTRLYDIVSRPQEEQPILRRLLDQHLNLRFRAAAVESAARRESVAESLMAEALSSIAPVVAEEIRP
jgi:CBS domain-containing protein